MKRDARLRGLSSERHQALVWARELTSRASASLGDIRARFDRELAPHFRTEEEVLLPALSAAGRGDLADRVAADHAALREDAALASGGDQTAARRLGEQLALHVRFEEREVFPACEALLPDGVLDEVARRT